MKRTQSDKKANLKTLKDFEGDQDYDEIERMGNFVLITDLRQEAIKWAKYYKENPKPQSQSGKVWSVSRIDFIKRFFNITEEDIK